MQTLKALEDAIKDNIQMDIARLDKEENERARDILKGMLIGYMTVLNLMDGNYINRIWDVDEFIDCHRKRG